MLSRQMKHRIEQDRVLILEREFDAPRELVFEMFKEPEHLRHWWGPKGWDLPFCKIDFRPSGEWHYCMKCVDRSQGEYYGMESCGKAIYQDIKEPESIVYIDYFSDKDGKIDESLPSCKVTIEFIELDGITKLVNHSEYASAEALQAVIDTGMLEGITETWDRLEELLNQLKKG